MGEPEPRSSTRTITLPSAVSGVGCVAPALDRRFVCRARYDSTRETNRGCATKRNVPKDDAVITPALNAAASKINRLVRRALMASAAAGSGPRSRAGDRSSTVLLVDPVPGGN